jgi:hypothetical protein
MWHTVSNRPPGVLSNYIYHPNNTTSVWGEDEYLDRAPVIGQWETVITRNKMNTPGKPDGILQSKLGTGDWYVNRSDYYWRPVATPKWTINRFCFSIFRGGNTDAWAVPVDTHVQFRKFKITTPI